MQAALAANTFAIKGASETKELSEMLPGILSQLGPDSLNSLKKLAQSYRGECSKKIEQTDVHVYVDMTCNNCSFHRTADQAGAEPEKIEEEEEDDDAVPGMSIDLLLINSGDFRGG